MDVTVDEELFSSVLTRVSQLHNFEQLKPLQHICLKYLIDRRRRRVVLLPGFGKKPGILLSQREGTKTPSATDQ